MGFVGLPVSLLLYWVVLRPKKEAPFPKGGLIALFVAGAVCILVSSVLTIPISALVVLLRSGAITDPVGFFQTISANHDALKEMLASTQDNYVARFFWSLFDMCSATTLSSGTPSTAHKTAPPPSGPVHKSFIQKVRLGGSPLDAPLFTAGAVTL